MSVCVFLRTEKCEMGRYIDASFEPEGEGNVRLTSKWNGKLLSLHHKLAIKLTAGDVAINKSVYTEMKQQCRHLRVSGTV